MRVLWARISGRRTAEEECLTWVVSLPIIIKATVRKRPSITFRVVYGDVPEEALMSEPVMCPGCGRTFPESPAGGKCPDCGATVATPGGNPSQDIDAEIARLSGTTRSCPTCGKPLPTGSSVCSFCQAEPEQVVRQGLPAWVKLLIILGFALVAGTITVVYAQRWGRERRINWVRDDLAEAKSAFTASRVGDAVRAIGSARRQLEWFQDTDPIRGVLYAEVQRASDSLRVDLEQKLQDMIKQGLVAEAETLYESEIRPIDPGGSLKQVIDKAMANRNAMRDYQKMLKTAREFHKEGSFAEALKEVSALRTKVEDPLKARTPAMADIRATVEKLQTSWVNEAHDKGMELIKNGKLAEASNWFKMGRKYVWSNEVALRRRLQEALYHIDEKRVAGAFVNVTQVRVVSVDEVRTELEKRLGKKLADEGFLTLSLKSTADAKATELQRIVVVDYKEEASREFTSEDMLKKATGTRIVCQIKVMSTKGGEPLWQVTITKQTGAKGGLGRGGFNDATLRLHAVRTFWQAFDGVRIPGRHLLP